MRARLERYFTRLWYADRVPPLPWRALTVVYRLAASPRWRPSVEEPPCPVLVVGNITIGGSGKTPVVAAIARLLAAEGYAPAVISRGYGGRGNKTPQHVSVGSDPALVGDEPVLLARRARCPVWVGRDRRAVLDAAVRAGADVVVADDGLQHPRLPRSFEICVIDGLRGLGNGHLLPAGPLRQPAERLNSVDFVLIKQAGQGTGAESWPGAAFSVVPGRAYRLDRSDLGQAPSLPSPGSVEFDAVCAIGNPDSFFALLETLGHRFRRRPFPDHHHFRASELADLPGPLLVTEKDAVKLERLARLPETWVLPIEAELPEALARAIRAHVREFRS